MGTNLQELIESEVKLLDDYDYASALVGVSVDNRAIYDYNLMIVYLVVEHKFTVDEAIEWIDYNTIRSLPYFGDDAPIIMRPIKEGVIDYEGIENDSKAEETE